MENPGSSQRSHCAYIEDVEDDKSDSSSSPSHSTIPAMEIPDSLQRSHHTYVEDDESDDYHLQENVGTDLDGDGVIVSLAHIQVR